MSELSVRFWKAFLIGVLGFCLMAPLSAEWGRQEGESLTDQVLIIPVGQDDLMNGQSFAFWKRLLARAQEQKPRAVVFELDTPGGLAMATKELMSQISQLSVPTYAFVTKEALSAGALVAVATDQIFMAPGSTIGAAAVVNATGMEIEKHMRAKIESAFDAHLRGILDAKGHSHEVVRAMMIIDEKEAHTFGSVRVEPGELLSLNAQEAAQRVEGGGPLLAEAVVESREGLLRKLGLEGVAVQEAQKTGMEHFAWWVAKYSALFIMIGLGAGYLELKMPGFGLGGIISLTAFGILFFGNYVAGGLAGYELAFFFVLGLALLAVEIFIIPGTGLTGLLGLLLVGGSLVLAMVDEVEWNEAVEEVGRGKAMGLLQAIEMPFLQMGLGLLGGTAVILLLMKYGPELPFLRRGLLEEKLGHTTPQKADGPVELAVGERGVVRSDLRPAGKGEFASGIFDVSLRTGYAPVGTVVEVVEAGRLRTMVRQVEGASREGEQG